MENPEYKNKQNELETLLKKYDAKTNGDVREIRKKIMLEKNPNIIKELGDKKWIEYLYNTEMPEELERYKESILKKINETQNSLVDPNSQFNPETGTFSAGFFTEDEKNTAINIHTEKLKEIEIILSKK